MMQFQVRKKGLKRIALSLVLAVGLAVSSIVSPVLGGVQVAQAAETIVTTISSMSYYSAADGPVITKAGVGEASFGFVMPKFNGGANTWEDVASDLTVNVKVDGTWVNIDSVTTFAYNVNWGNWTDSGFNGYWFKVSQNTALQLVSKATGVTLNYTLEFTDIPTTTITSMAATQGPNLTADVTGSVGFTYPIFNGNAAIPYAAVSDDLKVYVKATDSSTWIDIDNNAASGWIYDNNFGQFTDGGGGYWFKVDKSINVKFESISSMASLIYTISYSVPVRNSYTLTAYDATTFTADIAGSIGIPLPKIDGGAPVKTELDKFVYQVKVNGQWVELSDFSKSSFSYSGNGFNKLSDANQWGYWVDHIFGLWFQPIQVDMELRIGYPLNGQKSGDIGNNYVNYTFIGNPNAIRPDVSDLGNIEIGTTNDSVIDGMNLVLNDEFSGTQLDTSLWNYTTGYYLSNDPGTWGWGNAELEYYTDSQKNVFLQDGSLNIIAYNEPKSFPQDPSRYAQYSSGKITTKDKFTFKYGRIDFRAKLPTGNGMWPALWMLPNDDTYGTWAASGEIDVMEARGRLPGATCGTVHFGGTWPANKYIGGDYAFPDGQTINSNYHVYTAIWEDDNIKWYVDGKCFFKATKDQWYSAGASADDDAPFDQEFYIIMNLAVGGWFDGGISPDASSLPASMQVDYVRVYKSTGEENPNPVAVTGMVLDQTQATLTSIGQTTTLTKTITPSNATNKNVTWVSSNPSVATVSAGQVTAVSNGTTTITATTSDGGYSSNCVVTVATSNIAVTGVSLNKSTSSIVAGANETLVATITPTNATNKNVTWTSSNTAVATVNATGTVTGVSAGTATIKVTTVDGSKIANCVVTVTANNIAVTGVSLNKSTSSMVAGANETLVATITPTNATNKNVTWTSSNTAVATVNSTGTVTGVSAGTANITVTTVDGTKTATCQVTVTAAPVGNTIGQFNASLALSGTTLTVTLAPTVSSATASNLWYTDIANPTALSQARAGYTTGTKNASGNYVVTIPNAVIGTNGLVNLYLSTNTGDTGWRAFNANTTTTTVTTPTFSVAGGTYTTAQQVALSCATAGATIRYTTDGTTPTATSNLYSTAINVSATTTIKAIAINSGMTNSAVASATYTINIPVAVTGVSLNKSTSSMAVGANETLLATITPTNATNKNVTWTSSNTAVATVNATGTVTGVSAGTATIKVTTVDGSKIANCVVTVTAATTNVIGQFNVSFALSGTTLTVTLAPTVSSATASNLWYTEMANPTALSQARAGYSTGVKNSLGKYVVTIPNASIGTNGLINLYLSTNTGDIGWVALNVNN